jgi:hypothetical protein
MNFEALKARIFETLNPSQKRMRQNWINDVNNDPDPEMTRKSEDEHRKSAMGLIDNVLEAGKITPEEAERRKALWDVMHGY